MLPILLIEDDLAMRAAIQKRIAALGFRVIALDLPLDFDDLLLKALQACQQHQVAAAIVDLGLRGKDSGPSLIREFLKLEVKPRVVAITGDLKSPVVAQVPDEVPVLLKDRKLLPQDGSPGSLEKALSGVGAELPTLPSLINGYLEGLRVSSELWLSPQTERLNDISERLDYVINYLMGSPDHKKSVNPLLKALQEPWPPSPQELERLRDSLLKTASFMDATGQRDAIHFMTHDVANNFILGWQLLQDGVNDRNTALRFMQALKPSDHNYKLFERCAKLMGTKEEPAPKSSVEELKRVLNQERWQIATTHSQPLYLTGWGEFKDLLIVENDPVLRHIMASALGHTGMAVRTTLCAGAIEALKELEERKDGPGLAMLLDLSIPLKAGEQAESPEHGLTILAKAKELNIPVIVVSGVMGFLDIVKRCRENRPWAYLLKENHQDLLGELLSLFSPGFKPLPTSDNTLHLLVWTARHAIFKGKTIQFDRPGHRILEFLGEATPTAKGAFVEVMLKNVFVSLLNEGHIQPRADKELSLKAKLKAVRQHCQKLNKVLKQAILENQESAFEDLVQIIGDDFLSAKIRCDLPLKLYQEQLDVASKSQCPRLLLLEQNKDFTRVITDWLDRLTPSPEVVAVNEIEKARLQFEGASPPHIVVIEPKKLDEELLLNWIGELSQAAPPPDLILLARSNGERLAVRASERFGKTVKCIVKADLKSTMSYFCLAYTEIASRRSGLPIIENTGAPPPFLIKMPTIVKGQKASSLTVEINGISVGLRGDDVQTLFKILADHPLQHLRQQRLIEALEGGPCDRRDENYGNSDNLYKTVKKLRNQICACFARKGGLVGSEDLIRNGYNTYWLNGIVIR